VEAAVVVEPLAVEQTAHQHHRLVEVVEPVAHAAPEVDPERLVLAVEPRAADPEDGPAVADMVESGGELRGQPGVAERVGAHHQPEPNPGRDRADRHQERPALEDRLLPRPEDREEVIPGPDRVPACGLGGQTGSARLGPGRLLRPELGPELHRHASRSRTSGSRSRVSASYGAIVSTMMWRRPSSTIGRSSSAIFSGEPTNASSSSSASLSPFAAALAARTRRASAGSSRISIQTELVRSISSELRPTS